MKKPSSELISFSILASIILLQEGVILTSMVSSGKTEEVQLFGQWPFSAGSFDDSSGKTYDFAYNESHVELVIGFHGEESRQRIAAIVSHEKGIILNQFLWPNTTRSTVISVPTDRIQKLLRNLAKDENVEYVEPNWKYTAYVMPNDPGWIDQWGPSKIEASTAWDIQKGSNAVLVAVVDTGIYHSHPDLLARYVPLGYDWVNNDADPIDDNGHGTHCAGIIAAAINNSVGIAGLAQVQVMAEKALAHNGMGYSDDLAKAIVHATDQGAKIISCSWGSDRESQLIHKAIKYAANKGALVIAAAGNSGTSNRNYPAAYQEVIAVTATDENDRPAAFTSYGDWVDIAAPGTSIYSTFLWNIYYSMSGTSMACPHVAGVAALVWSQYPEMNDEQVRTQLLNTANDLGPPGFDVFYGNGRVNARKAVSVTISLTGSKILKAPANTVYFLYKNPSESTTPETAYDTVANGIIYGLTANPQRQGFTSLNQLVLETGALNTTSMANSTVVLLGGPCPQKTVGYYESERLTPLKFAANETHYKFITQSNQTIAELSKSMADSGHEDMFVIETMMDKTNLVVIMYGFTWKGTWASGIFFKETISKNLDNYSEGCYVFHWVDDPRQDGVPENSEIHLEYLVH